GPAGTDMHVEASYHHRYRKALEARFGASITWKNLGIGGTDASAGGTGVPEDRYDGSNPNRLQAIVDAKG
ncbi:hypothetical protein JI664_23785, partial [Rhodobacter sp. NTK016B]|uniref:hypothetical protein n=1 Tax=Rhodobacter sp. NTK016B TaxID=2759676 RepID=UPI001A8E503D